MTTESSVDIDAAVDLAVAAYYLEALNRQKR